MTFRHKILLLLKKIRTKKVKKVDHSKRIDEEDRKLIQDDYFLNYLVGRERELDRLIEKIFGYTVEERTKREALDSRRYEVRELKEVYKNAK